MEEGTGMLGKDMEEEEEEEEEKEREREMIPPAKHNAA